MPDYDVRNKYIDVTLNGSKTQVVRGLYQYDRGLVQRIHGLPANTVYSMQYGSIGGKGETIDALSTTENGVIVAQIPDSLLMLPRDMVCYIYVSRSGYGVTTYELMMPLVRRIMPGAFTMSQEQLDTYLDLINRANQLLTSADSLNSSSQSINNRLNTQLNKWKNASFYVDEANGNLIMEVGGS